MKKSTSIVMSVVMALSVIITSLWLFVEFKYDKPFAVSSAFVNKVVDAKDGTEKFFMEAQYYSNTNKTGEEVFEFQFNSYTDVNKSGLKTYGVQIVYEKDKSKPLFFYYEKTDGVSYRAITELRWGDPLIIDIDGDLFSVALTGTYQYTYKELADVLTIASRLVFNLFSDWTKLFSKSAYQNTIVETRKYKYEDFYNVAKTSLTQTSYGYGNYTLSFVELAKYFSLKKYNYNSKQFESLNQGGNEYVYNYFAVSVNNSRFGLTKANQSFYKMFKNDSSYNKSVIDDDAKYWNERFVIVLNDKDFKTRIINNITYLELNSQIKDLIIDNKNDFVKVEIDLSQYDTDIVALDHYAFEGLLLDELNVYNKTDNKEFNLNNNSQNFKSIIID